MAGSAWYQRFLNDVKTAKETRSVDPRMKNHEGRVFLTGRANKHRIMDLMVPLGVIGSFLYHKCPSSTMTASPLISVKNRNNRMEVRYQNHHGFLAEFDELCRTTKDKALEITKEVKELIGASDTALAISKADYLGMMEMFNVDPSKSSKKFDHAAKSIHKRRREDDTSPRRARKRYSWQTPTPVPSDFGGDSDDSSVK